DYGRVPPTDAEALLRPDKIRHVSGTIGDQVPNSAKQLCCFGNTEITGSYGGTLMALSRRSFLLTTLTALPAARLAAAKPEQNWPGFRGPGAQGVADGYPMRAAWSVDAAAGKSSGVLWRAEIPGLGHSSPIVWKDRIYLATAVPKAGKPSLRIGY